MVGQGWWVRVEERGGGRKGPHIPPPSPPPNNKLVRDGSLITVRGRGTEK